MSGGGLPTFMVLRSANSNKLVVPLSNGKLGSIGDDVLKPECKFELERAKTDGKEGLFSIRSCWNNKYWVREAADRDSIKAGAAEPNEDTSSWSCTLYRPAFVDGGRTTVTFKVAKSNHFVGSVQSINNPVYEVAPGSSPVIMKFGIINWESLVTLPKEVCFQGESEKYLAARTRFYTPLPPNHHRSVLRFDATDVADPAVVHEIHNNGDGTVLIRSKETGRYWVMGENNWVFVEGRTTIPNNSPMFRFIPVKANDGSIGLRSESNGLFCKRFTAYHLDDCLNANTSAITLEARMAVEEAVLERKISNVRYRLADALIRDEAVLSMAIQEATNHTTQTQITSLTFKRKETHKRTFERSVVSSLTVQNTISAGILTIVNAQVQITATVEGSFKWNEEKTEEKEQESTHQAPVPPRTHIIVTQVATQGRCDVPYSYTVTDRLTTGEIKTYDMHDGVYKGVNPYTFRYVTTEHPLPPTN